MPVDLVEDIQAEANDCAESNTDVMLRRLAGKRASTRKGYGEAAALYAALRELKALREDQEFHNDEDRNDRLNEMFDVIYERFFKGARTDGRK